MRSFAFILENLDAELLALAGDSDEDDTILPTQEASRPQTSSPVNQSTSKPSTTTKPTAKSRARKPRRDDSEEEGEA